MSDTDEETDASEEEEKSPCSLCDSSDEKCPRCKLVETGATWSYSPPSGGIEIRDSSVPSPAKFPPETPPLDISASDTVTREALDRVRERLDKLDELGKRASYRKRLGGFASYVKPLEQVVDSYENPSEFWVSYNPDAADRLVSAEPTGDPDLLEYRVDEELVWRVLQRIRTECSRAFTFSDDDGISVKELVLGTPQLAVLDPWAEYRTNKSFDEVCQLPVIGVPGPMVHAVVPNDELLTAHFDRRVAADRESEE